jgi:hypothetical protein
MNVTEQKHLLIDYGRRSYVFGLPWFTAFEDEPPRKSAADTVKKSNGKFDLLAIRTDEFPQFSISSSSQGIKTGGISAAAIISQLVGTDSWLYALEIEDSIWLCHGKDGFIMPDGDRLFDDREEAKREFLKLEPARWKSIHVPTAWKEEGTFPEASRKFLSNDEVLESRPEDIFSFPHQKWMRLNSVSSIAPVAKTLAVAGVLGTAAFFGYGFIFPEERGPTQADLEQRRQMLANRARSEKLTKFGEFDSEKPWKSIPLAQDFARACISTIQKMPLEAAGYRTTSASCEGVTATARLERQTNTFASWLQEWAKNQDNFDLDLAQDGSHAFLVTDITQLTPRGDERLSNYSLINSKLRETAAIEGGKITVSDPVTYQYPDYPDYVPLFGTSEISLATNRPQVWINSFQNLKGVSMESVTLDTAKMTYNFKGKLYVSNRN